MGRAHSDVGHGSGATEGGPRTLRSRSAPNAGAVLLAAAGIVASACAVGIYARAVWLSAVIGWVCLVPWIAVLDRTTSLRGALTVGLLMSVGFVIAVFPWFPQAVANYTGASWAIGAAAWILLAPALAPQFIALALGRHLAQRCAGGERGWVPAMVGGGLYVGAEWLWPKPLADTLAHGLFASDLLRQAADLFGAHGLTFALLAGNECALVAARGLLGAARVIPHPPSARRWAAALACLIALVGGLAAYGGVRLWQLRRSTGAETFTAAIVQSNLAHYDQLKAELGTFDALSQILEAHFSLSAEVLQRSRPDLLVWPETMYPTTFGTPKSEEGAAFDRAIAAFVNEQRVPLLFGAYDTDGSDEFNAAILLEPRPDQGVVFEAYRKTRLFPFTEYLPWPFDSQVVHRWLPWAGTWKPGGGPRVLPVSSPDRRAVRIAPLICYDAIDPSFAVAAVRQGAEVLVTLSNDSWFAYPGVQRLIMIVSAFRSVETRRPQLRATPTGVSAVIDETGALLESIDVDRRGTLVGTVRPVDGAWTLMLAWGNWFPPTALVAALGLLGVVCARRKEGRKERRNRENAG